MVDFGVTVPGAIVAKDVPRALENLYSGLESVPDIEPLAENTNGDQTRVSLHARAVPLIELLQSAVRDNNDVMWE